MRLAASLLLASTMTWSYALERKINEGEALFARHVYPMLQAKCIACHGEDPKKIKGDLWLHTREAMIKGGENGTALVPGDPDKSPIYVAVTWKNPDLEMPPKKNDRLNDKQIAALKRWIQLGAPWVDATRRAELIGSAPVPRGREVLTSVGGQSSDWAARGYKAEDLWSFRPLQKFDDSQIDKNTNPIDYFINSTLTDQGVTALAEADRLTLIRRATFDLTGLPPTPEEIDAFTMDTRPDAWSRLIDRLLDSPRYGEKWATHWLDVVRYADSSGFANDYPRPHAWRYRDYVIRAFNSDKPYDVFVREQIAGDEITENNSEALVATGYLRSGPWEHTSMSVAAVTRQLFLDDVTNSVGLTFLGHELRCAQCHDHKFDPIPTRDYYRIQSAFAPVQFSDRPAPWLAEENTNGFDDYKKRLENLQSKSGNVRSLRSIPESEWPVAEWDTVAEEAGHMRVNKKRGEYIKRDLEAVQAKAFSVKNSNPDTVHILKGGSLETPSDAVVPGTLAVLAAMRGDNDPVTSSEITTNRDGRRTALADWIISADNPLTARVMVNRIWMYHFGKGLAGNPNNFGAMGGKPTHPQLLDFLAQTFIAKKWSIKDMHRLIMSSDAYKRSSKVLPKEMAEKDPEGKSYARFRPRRLSAEEIRDSLLFVSGELNFDMGGLPTQPELNLEVAMQPRQIMGGIAMAYQPDPRPQQRHRRTIYTKRIRTLRDPMMEVFNQPNLDISAEKRDASTITPQAFTLMNSQNSLDRAVAMALRLEKDHDDLIAQVSAAFRLIYGRQPSLAERDMVLKHAALQLAHHKTMTVTPQHMPQYTIRQMVDEKTGVLFYWVEDLDIYRDTFIPDKKIWELSPHTRALADVCLVLMNSNEFIYVY